MVVMSLEKYSKMVEELETDKLIEENFGNVDIEKVLKDAENEVDDPNTKYFSHDEV